MDHIEDRQRESQQPPVQDETLWTVALLRDVGSKYSREEIEDRATMIGARNVNDAVTGAWIHWDRCFLQVFEGPRDAVIAIRNELMVPATRQDRPILAHDAPCDRRRFGESPMSARVATRPGETLALELAVLGLLHADRMSDGDAALSMLSAVTLPCATPVPAN